MNDATQNTPPAPDSPALSSGDIAIVGASESSTRQSSHEQDARHQEPTGNHNKGAQSPGVSVSARQALRGGRVLLVNRPGAGDDAKKAPSNFIRTSKYTWYNFLPKNLLEQFRRVANIYFLLVVIIQTIPGVSPFPLASSLVPLCVILAITAIKEGREDWKRHKADNEANSRVYVTLQKDESQIYEPPPVEHRTTPRQSTAAVAAAAAAAVSESHSQTQGQHSSEAPPSLSRPSSLMRTPITLRKSVRSFPTPAHQSGHPEPAGENSSQPVTTGPPASPRHMTRTPSFRTSFNGSQLDPSGSSANLGGSDGQPAAGGFNLRNRLLNVFQRTKKTHQVKRASGAGSDIKDKEWGHICSEQQSAVLLVGHVIRVYKGQEFPADLILLSSSSPDGMCFINTANLDGEAVPKPRSAPAQTMGLRSISDFAKLSGKVTVEPPSSNMHEFKASLVLDPHDKVRDASTPHGQPVTISISQRQLLLRGASLANTDYVTGIVVYTGPETKMMLNRNKARFKFSRFETILNDFIILLMAFNAFCCFLMSLLSVVTDQRWAERYGIDEHGFVGWILSFCTHYILFSWMIPISLYVTIELVKVFQAQFMEWDEKMRYKDPDGPPDAEPRAMKVNSSALNEELGNVDYVFTDKTGTLTQNKMELFRMSIAGDLYQHIIPRLQDARVQSLPQALDPSTNYELAKNPIDDPTLPSCVDLAMTTFEMMPFTLILEERQDQLRSNPEQIQLGMTFESIPESKEVELYPPTALPPPSDKKELRQLIFTYNLLLNNEITTKLDEETGRWAFQSQSPDEIALCEALAGAGLVRLSTIGNEISILATEQLHGNEDITVAAMRYVDQRKSAAAAKAGDASKSGSSQPSGSSEQKEQIPLSALNAPQPWSSNEIAVQTRDRSNTLRRRNSMARARSSSVASGGSTSSGTVVSPVGSPDGSPTSPAPTAILPGINGNAPASAPPTPVAISVATTEPPSEPIPAPLLNTRLGTSVIPDAAPLPPLDISEEATPPIEEDEDSDVFEVPADPAGLAFFTVLAQLEFTSSRRRSGVVVRCGPNGPVFYLVKGADSTIMPMCTTATDEAEKHKSTTSHHASLFATRGSRTLVMAGKLLTESQLQEWLPRYRAATNDMNDRDAAVLRCFEELEVDLELGGCTAVNDQLQENVPETINFLLSANIKVIVLTGDKRETAETIARDCRIIQDDMHCLYVKSTDQQLGEDLDEEARVAITMKSLKDCADYIQAVRESTSSEHLSSAHDVLRASLDPTTLEEMMKSPEEVKATHDAPRLLTKNPVYGPDARFIALLSGHTLEMALRHCREQFLEIFKGCASIVTYRSTPRQKALVVNLVKHDLKKTCLAIGDGANDVSMIQEAHVGVGILGKEGSHAAMSSDYVIHRFGHLRRLLFIHGRYSLYRTAKIVMYSFYKNFVFVMPVVYYSFFDGYSGQVMCSSYFMSVYNLFFTSLPPLCFGVFDRDVPVEILEKTPEAYDSFKKENRYNFPELFRWLGLSFVQSVIVFFYTYEGFYKNDISDSSGKNDDLFMGGTAMTFALVIAVNIVLLFGVDHVVSLQVWSFVIGIILFFVTYMVLSLSFNVEMSPESYGIMERSFAQPKHWLWVILTIGTCTVIWMLWRAIQVLWMPDTYQRLQFQAAREAEKRETETRTMNLAKGTPAFESVKAGSDIEMAVRNPVIATPAPVIIPTESARK